LLLFLTVLSFAMCTFAAVWYVRCCRLVRWHVVQLKLSWSTCIVVFIHLACRSPAILKYRLKVSELAVCVFSYIVYEYERENENADV